MRNITIWFIVITCTVIAVYDVWIILEAGNQESVSAHLLSIMQVVPQAPLLLGYIFGHLTYPYGASEKYRNAVMPISVAFGLCIGYLMIIDVYQLYWGGGIDAVIFGGKKFEMHYIFLLGNPIGWLLWPMPKSKWSNRFGGKK